MGSSRDFDDFYAARSSMLVRNIYLSTGDLTRAQDCVQEAFIRAWARWDRLDSDDPVAWVTTVAWRLAIKDWRRVTRELKAFVRIGEAADVEPPTTDVLSMRQALAGLPQNQRTVLVLFYFEDLSIQAIAEVLSIPQGTVKSHLSRGRDTLRSLFAADTEVS